MSNHSLESRFASLRITLLGAQRRIEKSVSALLHLGLLQHRLASYESAREHFQHALERLAERQSLREQHPNQPQQLQISNKQESDAASPSDDSAITSPPTPSSAPSSIDPESVHAPNNDAITRERAMKARLCNLMGLCDVGRALQLSIERAYRSSASPSPPASASSLIASSNSSMEETELTLWRRAHETFSIAAAEDHTQHDIWNNLGYNLLTCKSSTGVDGVFDAMLSVFPEYDDAQNNRGVSLLSSSSSEDAIKHAVHDFQFVSFRNKTHAEALSNYAVCMLAAYSTAPSSGESLLANALRSLNECVKVSPSCGFLFNNLAIAYSFAGNWTEAVKAIENARMHEPEDVSIACNSIRIYGRAGKYEDATHLFAQIQCTRRDLLPRHEHLLWVSLAEVYQIKADELEKQAAAGVSDPSLVASLPTAAEVEESRQNSFRALASSLHVLSPAYSPPPLVQDQSAAASSALQPSGHAYSTGPRASPFRLNHFPDTTGVFPDTSVWNAIGLSSLTSGDYTKAQEFLRTVLASDLTNMPALLNVGVALSLNGAAEALKLLETGLRVADQQPPLRRFQALIPAEQRHSTHGEYSYIVYNNLGNHYRSHHQYQEALDAYKKCLECKPGYAAAYNNMALVYLCIDDLPSASRMLEAALESDPSLQCAHSNRLKLQKLMMLRNPATVIPPSPVLTASSAPPAPPPASAAASAPSTTPSSEVFSVPIKQEPSTPSGRRSASHHYLPQTPIQRPSSASNFSVPMSPASPMNVAPSPSPSPGRASSGPPPLSIVTSSLGMPPPSPSPSPLSSSPSSSSISPAAAAISSSSSSSSSNFENNPKKKLQRLDSQRRQHLQELQQAYRNELNSPISPGRLATGLSSHLHLHSPSPASLSGASSSAPSPSPIPPAAMTPSGSDAVPNPRPSSRQSQPSPRPQPLTRKNSQNQIIPPSPSQQQQQQQQQQQHQYQQFASDPATASFSSVFFAAPAATSSASASSVSTTGRSIRRTLSMSGQSMPIKQEIVEDDDGEEEAEDDISDEEEEAEEEEEEQSPPVVYPSAPFVVNNHHHLPAIGGIAEDSDEDEDEAALLLRRRGGVHLHAQEQELVMRRETYLDVGKNREDRDDSIDVADMISPLQHHNLLLTSFRSPSDFVSSLLSDETTSHGFEDHRIHHNDIQSPVMPASVISPASAVLPESELQSTASTRGFLNWDDSLSGPS